MSSYMPVVEIFGSERATEYMWSSIPLIEDFYDPRFAARCKGMAHAVVRQRKLWEFVYIAEMLDRAGCLVAGKKGVGFGCGSELLPAYFASKGCEILASDAPDDQQLWSNANQHASSKEVLFHDKIINRADFDRLISFKAADMNSIPPDVTGFDFAWSACCLEHLGSLDHGLNFIEASLATVKPGGWVCHTTEFNLSSNDDTINAEGLAFYRKRDLEAFFHRMRALGHRPGQLNLKAGTSPIDFHVDFPPIIQGRI